ncbi:hypothetical protein D9M72_448960 [compost metagenome]
MTAGDEPEYEHRECRGRLQQTQDHPDGRKLRQVLADDCLPVASEGKFGCLGGGKDARPIKRRWFQGGNNPECAPCDGDENHQPFRQAEEGTVAAVSQHQEDNAEHGIGGENIAMEEQNRMGDTDQPEAGLPTQEPRHEGLAGFFRRAHLQGEAVAE